MKRNGKRIFPSLAAFLVITTSLLAVPSSANRPEAEDAVRINKDETVYVSLEGSGSIREINVVNSFPSASGTIIDYGNYENIVNLTNNGSAKVSGKLIQFGTDSEAPFFYQGQPRESELPWIFRFDYELDGKPVDFQALSGAEGRLKMTLQVLPNEQADSFFRDRYMLQISVPLQLDKATNISAPDAAKVVVGRLATLAFTVFPGDVKTFDIDADIRDFTMDAVSITAVKASMPLGEIDEISSGFSALNNGFDELIQGTSRLKNGMVQVNKGLGGMNGGLTELAAGHNQLVEGMNKYHDGLSAYLSGFPLLRTGSSEIRNGLSSISDNSGQVVSGYRELDQGLSSLLQNQEQLTMLATALLHSPDPNARILAEAMLMQLGGLGKIQSGLRMANDGLSAYTGGIEALADEYAAFDQGMGEFSSAGEGLLQGFQEIYQGAGSLQGGFSQLQEGFGRLTRETASVPRNVEKLLQGQRDMKKGIKEAKDTVDSLTGNFADQSVVSFAAPGIVVPDSVQFIFRTPALTNPKEELSDQAAPEKKSVWQRLLDLFNRS